MADTIARIAKLALPIAVNRAFAKAKQAIMRDYQTVQDTEYD